MSVNIKLNDLNLCIKVAACICAKDGVISEVEENTIFQFVQERYPEVGVSYIEAAITEFFDSNDQIEDYANMVTDHELRRFAIELSEVSASADGLDIQENIALEKVSLIWGLSSNA